MFVITCIITSMARNSLLCADVPLRNYSLTHSRWVAMEEAVSCLKLLVSAARQFRKKWKWWEFGASAEAVRFAHQHHCERIITGLLRPHWGSINRVLGQSCRYTEWSLNSGHTDIGTEDNDITSKSCKLAWHCGKLASHFPLDVRSCKHSLSASFCCFGRLPLYEADAESLLWLQDRCKWAIYRGARYISHTAD